jgi:hypothetical protein
MIQLAISSFLVGAVFGLRFKVMVVMPLTVIGGLAIGLVSLLTGHTDSVVLLILAFAGALQAGYMFGSFTRFTMAAMRVRGEEPARSPVKSAQ